MRETYQIEPGRTVTVTIEASDAPATGERLYTAREVGDLQASEAELVSAPLRRELAETKRELDRRTQERDERERARAGQEARVRELERLLALSVAREDALEVRVSGLLGELAGAENRVRAYDQDRHTERDRANQNRAWAERAEAATARMAEEKREAVQALAEKLGQVAGAVHGAEVRDALARLEPSEADYVLRLAHAVRVVRDIVGSPTPPVTSQA